MRVATFALSNQLMQAALKTQSDMADLTLQQASGSVSSDYGGLGSDADNVVDLEVTLARSEAYESAADEASGRIDAIYSVLTSISDVLDAFRSELTTALSTDSDELSDGTLQEAAQTYLDELESLLNTQYEGRYLFSGSATTTASVDLDNYTYTDADTESTSYYSGTETTATVRISEDQVIDYGITASDSAFESAIRSLYSIANADGELDDDTIQAAMDLIEDAVDGVAALEGTIGSKQDTIERVMDQQADLQLYLEEEISDLKDVDVTAVAVSLTNYETQLEALYSAIATLSSMSITSYLS